MTPRRISPATAILLLAAALGGSGQAPPAVGHGSAQQSVEARTPTPPQTKTNTTAPSYAQQIAEKIGGRGGNPGQRRNLKRQARRVLERIGVIDSGRQWRKFRQATRTNPAHAELWQLALRVAKYRIKVAV